MIRFAIMVLYLQLMNHYQPVMQNLVQNVFGIFMHSVYTIPLPLFIKL